MGILALSSSGAGAFLLYSVYFQLPKVGWFKHGCAELARCKVCPSGAILVARSPAVVWPVLMSA